MIMGLFPKKFLLLCLLVSVFLSLQSVHGKKLRSRYTYAMNRGIRPTSSEAEEDGDLIGNKRVVRDIGDDEGDETESEEAARILLEEEYDEEEKTKNHDQRKRAPPDSTTNIIPPTTTPGPILYSESNPSDSFKIIKLEGSNTSSSTTPKPLPKPTKAPEPTARQGELYLPEGYNNLEIPKLDIGKLYGIKLLQALPCLVFIDIRSIRGIDELKEEVTIELDLVVEWIDGLLFDITKVKRNKAPTQKVLNPIFLRKIWTPDIYMDNLISKAQPSLMAKPLSLKFSPETGFISYTTRVALTLDCDMFFHYYPADTQRCEFQLKSFSHFSSDLDLSWLQHGVYLNDPSEPNFDIQVESVEQMKVTQIFNNPRNETHDALQFTILARRKLSFHLVQTYLPSIFFIIITWLCFLIPARYVEARIGISMTTLLTLTSMFAAVRESTPIVSYVKAIDIWMVACIFFVFLTLLEFSFYVWIKVEEKEESDQGDKFETSAQKRERRRSGESESVSAKGPPVSGNWHEFIEKHGFLIFLLIFIVFNVVYWTWLLEASEYFNWTVNATHNSIEDDS